MKIKALLAAGLLVSLAAPANAAFVNGSISYSDGFDPEFGGVVGVSPLPIAPAAVITGCSGDFAGCGASANASAFTVPLGADTVIYTHDGWTFNMISLAIEDSDALSCDAAGLCRESLTLSISGLVSGNAFDPTTFIGTWTGQSSCLGSAGNCTDDATRSWSSSIVAIGRVQVAEPATLLLLGLGLAGMGFIRRRTA